MAFTTIKDATANGFRIRLVDQSIAAFAVILEHAGTNLVDIKQRTTDPVAAGIMFKRSVALAEQDRFSHPAWKRWRVEIA